MQKTVSTNGKEENVRQEGLGRWVSVNPAAAEDLSLVLRTHAWQLTTVYNSSSGAIQWLWPPVASALMCIHTRT